VSREDGVRIERTGIALVHKGEMVLPAPGSEASVVATRDESGVHYHFPVEIEVRSANGADPEAAVARALDALAAHLGAL
jgi:hypothetical protein